MLRYLITSLLIVSMLLAPLPAADRATVITHTNGQTFVITYTSSGVLVITDVTVIKLEEVKPPPNPQNGLAHQLVILRNQRQPKLVPVLLDLQFKYQRGTKPELYLKDNIDSDPVVQAYLKLKEKHAPDAVLPYYFLVDAGGRVLSQGPVLDTTEKNVELIKKFQEIK